MINDNDSESKNEIFSFFVLSEYKEEEFTAFYENQNSKLK